MIAGRPRLPLTVIGGFLGSGKTTLLNRLLCESAGRRLAVLVNDFGALNIDAELVAVSAGDTIALTNGCVCCSIGDDLTDALIRVLAAEPPFDAVVIEASGVSDPWRIAQVGLADPGLSLEGVIVLVDAGAVLEQSADPLLADTVRRQLKSADLVVVNKVDLANEGQRRRVLDWVSEVAGVTPVFETERAALPAGLLAGPLLAPAARTQTADGGGTDDGSSAGHLQHDHAGQFETWSCRPCRVLEAQPLREWLRSRPQGVLRLKGLVRTDEHGWAEIQFSGRHGSLRKAAVPPAHGAAVVAIGLRGHLPAAALEATFGPPPTR